jgi:hypothetical protein
VKLLSLRTRPFVSRTFQQMERVTTRVAVERVQNK